MIICPHVCFLGVNYFLFFHLLNFLCTYCLFVPNASTDLLNAWQSLFLLLKHQIFHQFQFSCPGDLPPQHSVLLL